MITVTTHTGWFSRLGSSVAGVVFGLLLLAGCVWALSWNEGRAVNTERSLKEGKGDVISVPSAQVNPANEGRLIHTTGELVIAEPLKDADFAIQAQGVRLVREAEMFQWVEDTKKETRTKLGGGEETVTVYDYRQAWQDDAVDSTQFRQQEGHHNPPMPVEDRTISAPRGTMGAFTVGDNVMAKMADEQAVPITEAQQADIQQAVGSGRQVTVTANQIWFGDPAAPKVGDVRIRYTVVPAGQISVVGAQTGNGFAPYQTKASDALLMVNRGAVTAAEMFKQAEDANRAMTWAIRVAGIIGLMIGFGLVMGPIGVLADFIPFLGALARLGTAIIGFVLAILVGFVTIAIAWFAVRPVLSIILLVVAGVVTAGFIVLGRKKDRERAAAAPEPAPAEAG